MLRFIISFFLIGIALPAMAQDQEDSTAVRRVPRKVDIQQRDSVPQIENKFLPTGIVFGVDVLNGTKSVIKDNLDWYNFMATIDFWRYEFSVDYGKESRSESNATSDYENSGSYIKFGPNVNFLYNDPDMTSLFIGLRYATNTFSDKLEYNETDPLWEDRQEVLENTGLHAKWIEVVGGLRVKLFRAVWMGYTGRFKFGVDSFSDQSLIPNYVPGYGRADLQSTWEFNYWIMIRLPLSTPDPRRFEKKK